MDKNEKTEDIRSTRLSTIKGLVEARYQVRRANRQMTSRMQSAEKKRAKKMQGQKSVVQKSLKKS